MSIIDDVERRLLQRYGSGRPSSNPSLRDTDARLNELLRERLGAFLSIEDCLDLQLTIQQHATLYWLDREYRLRDCGDGRWMLSSDLEDYWLLDPRYWFTGAPLAPLREQLVNTLARDIFAHRR